MGNNGNGEVLGVGEVEEVDSYLPDLPIELWEPILFNLRTLDDMRNAINCYQRWKISLKLKRQFWMFPNVVPLIVSHLDMGDLLSCRLVCKPWSQGVTEFLEGAHHLAPYSRATNVTNNWREELSQKYFSPFVVDDTDKSLSFWKALLKYKYLADSKLPKASKLNYQPNLLTGRALEVKAEVGIFKNIVEKLGQNIWHLTLAFKGTVSCMTMMTTLCSALEQMENLRQLRLSGRNYFEDALIKLLKRNGMITLEGSRTTGTYPKLLKTLQIEWEMMSYDCLNLDEKIIRQYCSSLERLEVTRWREKELDLAGSSVVHFRNLRELHITTEDGCIGIVNSLSYLIAPQLRKLCLKFNHNIGVNGREFLEVFYKFGQLEVFQLHFRHWEKDKELIRSFFRSFNNIPALELASFPLIRELDVNYQPLGKVFLQSFPNIRCLRLNQDESEPILDDNKAASTPGGSYKDPFIDEGAEKGEMDKIQSSRVNLNWECSFQYFTSEIWQLFPSLEVVYSGGNRYTREKRRSVINSDVESSTS